MLENLIIIFYQELMKELPILIQINKNNLLLRVWSCNKIIHKILQLYNLKAIKVKFKELQDLFDKVLL